MKIIGLDVGEKRIGVAKVDSSTRIAVPVGFVETGDTMWQELAKLSRINTTNFFVLGLPRSNEGNETKQSLYVRNFARVLTEKIPGAKVRFQDESLTSVEAESRLKQRKKKYVKGDIDAEAATIILQDFIENFNESAYKKEAAKVDQILENINPVVAETKKIAKNTKGIAKKQGDKIALNARKTKNTLKKFLIISPIALILIIVAIVGVVIWRQNQLREREQMWADMEAAMVPDVFSITIKPGETIFDIKEMLLEHGYDAAEIDAAFRHDYSNEAGLEFLKERPAGATLEGYIFGETREFYTNTSVEEILKIFLMGTGEIIAENDLVAKYKAHGLTLFEGITLASIVQKEAKSADQPTVAQVFLSRLEQGMALGSDVTVTYALDIVDPNRETYKDNQSALLIDSCYNTRLHAGLPCGPISNPGLSALLAVAEPSDTSYLYFLTGDDGMMYYSYTDSEHAQNAAKYCSKLCQVSL
ncbi:endolytic transglycosylase MltG [Candidatus Saccharibacteria bacterium]|nr:endolytic transglycosylase MltG [Candidatus Saccharibacteria bacterium]